MKKPVFYTELCYLAGLAVLGVGTALMERADFGMSMVVAPAYLLHLKLSPVLPFFSFGMAEYTFQAVILVLLSAVLRRFRPIYLFSFVTAVLYGLVLDVMVAVVGLLPPLSPWLCFPLGVVCCSAGVSMLFHNYFLPEASELFVKELSRVRGLPLSRVKTAYDCTSCALSVVMSFAFFGFGHFEGIKLGTVVCALVNGRLIGWFGGQLERHFTFRDALPLRRRFEQTV